MFGRRQVGSGCLRRVACWWSGCIEKIDGRGMFVLRGVIWEKLVDGE